MGSRSEQRHRSPRLQGDGGSVVVEAALVLPLIFVFVAGIVDFGVGFRDRTLLQSAMRNGARVGAAAVADPSADQLVLSTFQAGLAGTTRLTVDRAIIYEANGLTNGEPTSTCQTITPSNVGAGNFGANCNVYSGDQVTNAATSFNAAPTYLSGTTVSSNCGGGWNRYWCAGGASGSNERTANLSGTVDSLGLYVRAAYTPFTGVFETGDLILTDWVVMRLEPLPG
jgi:Flp pilus assembly protein TadG